MLDHPSFLTLSRFPHGQNVIDYRTVTRVVIKKEYHPAKHHASFQWKTDKVMTEFTEDQKEEDREVPEPEELLR